MCSHPPRHQHTGRCSLDVIEDVQFLAEQDGVTRQPTKVGYPRAYRRQLAGRFGMSEAAFDRALYRRSAEVAR